MKKTLIIFLVLSLCLCFPACNNGVSTLKEDKDRLTSIEGLTEEEISSQLSLRQKAAQMVQAERASITLQQAVDYGVGSVFSSGGSTPYPNTPSTWVSMYNAYQSKIIEEEQIPIIYGVDAVHGHNTVYGATVFPHNIGLGVTRNPELI